MRHDSGLHVLAAPAAPESSETITKAHVKQILSTLLDGYDMVVVDAGSTLDERVLTDLRGRRVRPPARSPRRSARSRRCMPCSNT